VEIEDILGEEIIIDVAREIIDKRLGLEETDRSKGSLPSQIRSAADRLGINLPDGRKASVAIKIVSEADSGKITLQPYVLDLASELFREIRQRFESNV
jgi:hypothetical protein